MKTFASANLVLPFHWFKRLGRPAVVVTALIFAHFTLGYTSLLIKSPTADEYTYIATGYLYWQTGDFRLDRTHPPLLRLLIGLPLQALPINMPTLQRELWDTSASYTLGYPLGWSMLLGEPNRGIPILTIARLPILLLSCVLGFLVYKWAGELYGASGGLIALTLYVFSPNMLAHARLATMDLGLCFFFLLTLYTLSHAMKRHAPAWLAALGVATFAAFAAKATALLLLPLIALALLRGNGQWASPKQYAVSLAIVVSIAAVGLFAIYGFPFKPFYYWDTLSNVFVKSLQLRTAGANIPGMPHQNHAFYLFGEYSTQGWPYYFLAALAVKTPVVVWALLLAAFVFCRPREWQADALLFGAITLLLAASALNRVNIGVRHVLPFYPLLFVYLGRVNRLFAFHWGDVAVFALLICFASGTLLSHPNYIPYFNAFTGGPRYGHGYLDDSNLDWGQDLGRLADLPQPPDYVATNWAFEAEAFGLNAQPLDEKQIADPPPGLIAVGKHWAIRHRVNPRSPHYFDWMQRYPLVGHVGHSIWLFDTRSKE